MKTIITLLSLVTPFSLARIESIPAPPLFLRCLRRQVGTLKPHQLQGEEVVNFCMNEFTFKASKSLLQNDKTTPDIDIFIQKLFENSQVPDTGRKVKRVRKEYRRMTEKEREDYHRAVNMLKQDKSVKPNCYDAIANFHRGPSIQSAHFGCAFPAWHRVFLLVYEAALRLKVPSVTVPYWFPPLDDEMNNPADSVLFSEKFAGNGDGQITNGPFAGWSDGSGRLTRNVWENGELVTNQNVNDVLSRRVNRQIMTRRYGRRFGLEQLHSKCHSFVGGHMGRLETAARDPLFFNLHAFVDCWWEKFRKQQKRRGINPANDYPAMCRRDRLHHPGHLMDGFRASNSDFYQFAGHRFWFKNFTNFDGYSNFTENIYECEDFPSCSPANSDCGSEWLVCDKRKWVCVSKSKDDRLDRPDASPSVLNSVQNLYEINGVADSAQWAYLPCKIVMERRQSGKFGSKPVHKGNKNSTCDVFCEGEKSLGIGVKPSLKSPKTYRKHVDIGSGFEKVYVQADGSNYVGNAIEYAVMDQRFTMSEGITYVPFRMPTEDKNTEVIITAFDSGGRLCRPFCRNPENPTTFKLCSGNLRISNQKPLGYGFSYAKTVLDRWDFSRGCPQSNDDDVFIKFMCDSINVWPWEEHDAQAHSDSIRLSLEKAVK